MGIRIHRALAGIALAVAAVSVKAQGTIEIGLVNEATCPNAEAGVYLVHGARLALEEVNPPGGILGRKAELELADIQSTYPRTVLAFSRLFSQLFAQKDTVAIIGTIRPTQIQAASPAIAKSGIPVMIGGTNPTLTKVDNRWLFRGRPSDSYPFRVIADFGLAALKKSKWAIIHSTDAFGAVGMNARLNARVSALEAQGIASVPVQGYPHHSQVFTPVVLAVEKSGGDIVGVKGWKVAEGT